MKLKNILSIFCFLALVVSCSSDGDAIMNDVTASSDQSIVTSTNAFISMNLTSNVSSTKATGEAENGGTNSTVGQAISSCSLILYRGTELLAIRDGVAVNNNVVEGSILTKVRDGVKLMVIANSTINFSGYTSLSAIKAAVQTVSAFNENKLLKVGEADVTFEATGDNSSFKASTGTAKTTENTFTVTVPVNQLSAKIELSEFNVIYNANSKNADVTITSVSLSNINTEIQTGGIEVSGIYSNKTWSIASPIKVYDAASSSQIALSTAMDGNIPVFYSFPNTNASKPVTMSISFKVGSNTYEKSFVINRPTSANFTNNTNGTYVKSNYIYRLKLNMTITNRDVDLSIICYTQDWINHTVSESLVEVTE